MSRKKKRPVSKKRILFILFGITIPILNFLVFYIYPNISAITMGFLDSQGQISTINFQRFFKEFQLPTSDIRIAFKNTFLTFGILFVVFPFKVMVSYFIYAKIPFYKFYRIVFFLPAIIFSIAVSMVFMQMVGVEGAIAQLVQKWCNLDYSPELLAESRFANVTVILNMLWLGFPGDLVIWGGTFARIPEDVLESGKIDGVTWWTEFTRIIVPMVWPTVALQMVLLVCGIFGSTGNVFLLTGGQYGTITISAWMYITLLQNSGSMYSSNVYNYMSAVGLLITSVSVVLSLIIRKYANQAFEEVEY